MVIQDVMAHMTTDPLTVEEEAAEATTIEVMVVQEEVSLVVTASR